MPKTALDGTSAVRKILARDCAGPVDDCISAAAELPAEKRRDQREPGQISYHRPGDGGDGDDDDGGLGHQRLPAAPTHEEPGGQRERLRCRSRRIGIAGWRWR